MIKSILLNEATTYGVELPLTEQLLNEYKNLLVPKLYRAAKGRQEEFIASRACAQFCLSSLGLNGFVGYGDDRRPMWPKGVVGSITHSKEFAMASVASSKEFISIGIDCETIMTKEKFDSLADHIATKDDLKIFNSTNQDITSTIIFSAKESLYKLINPLCNRFFGFEHASLRSLSDQDFEIELHSDLSEVKDFNKIYKGSYKILQNQIVTSLVIER